MFGRTPPVSIPWFISVADAWGAAVNATMAGDTQGDQIFIGIVAQLAAPFEVMNLEI